MKSNDNSSKKKPSFKLGSKARKALKAAAARESSSASGGECIEEKQTKSFRYDEEKDEELKRLRALYASGAVGEKDEGNTECNNWRTIDVNSQFLVGSSEEGFVSLEVLSTEKEGEKDDAKTKKTKNETAKKSASKNDNNDDCSITVREKENEKEKEDGKEKKEATKSKASNAKEARILKRKKRWKEKVEEAKKRKRNEKDEAKRGDGETAGGGGGDYENEDDDLLGDEEDVAAWAQYDLHPLLLKAIRKLRFTSPTPIQEKVLHPAIKGRMDIVGAAETGSGKTLAFGLPILQRLMQDKEEEKWYEEYADEEKPGKGKKHLRALIVTPTRELALQVAKMLADVAIYTGIKIAAIVGGMSSRNKREC